MAQQQLLAACTVAPRPTPPCVDGFQPEFRRPQHDVSPTEGPVAIPKKNHRRRQHKSLLLAHAACLERSAAQRVCRGASHQHHWHSKHTHDYAGHQEEQRCNGTHYQQAEPAVTDACGCCRRLWLSLAIPQPVAQHPGRASTSHHAAAGLGLDRRHLAALHQLRHLLVPSSQLLQQLAGLLSIADVEAGRVIGSARKPAPSQPAPCSVVRLAAALVGARPCRLLLLLLPCCLQVGWGGTGWGGVEAGKWQQDIISSGQCSLRCHN